MVIKSFIKEKGYNIRSLAQATGIPYSSLNDIVNGKIAIDNVALWKCRAIACELGITIEELYDMCFNEGTIIIGEDASAIVKNQSYYFKYKDEEKYLCKVNEYNSGVVREIATWEYEDIKSQEQIDELARKALENE